MRSSASRRLLIAAAAAILPLTGEAGEIADNAATAEQLLDAGKPGDALAAFDRATAAFFDASPLQLRVAVFADKVTGFGDYDRRSQAAFKAGDTLRVYLEPVGYAFTPEGDRFKVALAADVEIRTPGGLILGKADDVVRLEWNTGAKTREVDGVIALPLPKLKAGDYQLLVTLRDLGGAKTATASLPFSVTE